MIKEITLKKALNLGDREIKTLKLREPVVLDFQDLEFKKLLNLDTKTIMLLLERINQNSLNYLHLGSLSLPDFSQIMEVLADWFTDPKDEDTAAQ